MIYYNFQFIFEGLNNFFKTQSETMKPNPTNVSEILEATSPEKKEVLNRLHETILKNIPKGFETTVSYGMIAYVVPHSLYPAGYHCKPTEPLPLAYIAAQKNSINLYHMGIYADPELMNWFTSEYAKISTKKMDMGKSCIRFKKAGDIPFDLIGKLMKKLTPKQWIELYEKAFRK